MINFTFNHRMSWYPHCWNKREEGTKGCPLFLKNAPFPQKIKFLCAARASSTTPSTSSVSLNCSNFYWLAHPSLPTDMVLINLKSTLGANNNDEFLYETKASTKVDELIESLVEIHNARVRSCFVADAVKALATYGVAERPDNGGTDRVSVRFRCRFARCSIDNFSNLRMKIATFSQVRESLGKEIEEEPINAADPNGLRSGPPPDAHVAEKLMRAVETLEEYVHKKQVLNKVSLTLDGIVKNIDNVRDAVTVAYPSGLPEWDVARFALDEPIEKLRGLYLEGSLIDAKNASLWTCNKEFLRGTLVSDRLGSCNEKTKVIAKLTTKGSGPPVREPIVSEAERNAMAAFYFKRQEELKSLAQADEDDYLNSQWADPKGMRRNLQGLSDVKTPGELSRLRL
jgi:hypothetical protein